jgi:hypothetical protein
MKLGSVGIESAQFIGDLAYDPFQDGVHSECDLSQHHNFDAKV